MALKTIVYKGSGIRKEAVAGGAITPGHLVALDSSGDLIVHATNGGQAQRAFAVENELNGGEIGDAYATLDRAFYEVLPHGAEVYGWLADEENAAIGNFLASFGDGTMKVLDTIAAVVQATGAVTDDDSAASNGLVVYLHLDENGHANMSTGHLESVTAGDADSYFDIGVGGGRIQILDDDAAATAGLQVYFDEDAANEDERFLVNNTVTLVDVFIFDQNGRAIRIKHDATASTNGVALYFDDDATNEEERLLFISPTDTDGAYNTDDTVTLRNISGPETAICIAVEAVNNVGGSGAVRIKMEVL